MTPSPSPQRHALHKKNQYNDNDVTRIAWTEPKNPQIQKARRVKVWLKHSITNLASPSAVDFLEHGDNSGNANAKSPPRRGFRHSDPARRPLQHEQPTTTQSTTTRSEESNPSLISTTTSRQTTKTIDQAMFSLYTYVGPQKHNKNHHASLSSSAATPETPSSYVPRHDYDWLLDGVGIPRTDDLSSSAAGDEIQQQEQTEVEEGEGLDLDDNLKYVNYHLNQPWDIEAYLKHYLQQREAHIQHEMQQEEQAFQFDANFEETAAVSPQTLQAPLSVVVDNEAATDTTCIDDDDDDDFGDFQTADDMAMATTTPAHQAITAGTSASSDSNMFETPLPPPQPVMKTITAVRTDGPEIVVSKEDESVLVAEVDGDPQKSANHQPNNTEDIEESKSQEEAIVEEAVEILRSLPSKDFNEAFDSSNNGLPCNEVLVETCNLASELEGDDEEAGELETGSSSSPTPQQQQPQLCTVQETNHEMKESNATTTATTEQVSSSEDFKHQDGNDDSDGAASCPQDAAQRQNKNDTSFNISEIDEDESCSSSTSDDEETTSCAPTQHDEAAPADGTTVDSSASTPVPAIDDPGIDHRNEHSASKDDGESDSCDSDSKEAAHAGQQDEDDDDDEDDESFGDFCDAPAATAGEVAEEAKQQVELFKKEHTPSPPQQEKASRAPFRGPSGNQSQAVIDDFTRTNAASIPTFAVLPPLRVDTAVQAQQQAEEALRQRTQDKEHAPVSQQEQQQQQHARQVPGEVFEDPFNGREDLDDSEYVDGGDSESEGVQDSDIGDIRVSLRLPIPDLSTREARFARRQQLRHKEELRVMGTDHHQLQQQMSTSSLFSVSERVDDEDENGEPLLSLADLDLPQYYFTQENFDDTARVVQNAPWHHISNMWESEGIDGDLHIPSAYSFEELQDRRAFWEDYITQQLCHLDAAHNQVAKHLLRRIQPHEAVLQKANRSIHDFATNLQLAQMYLTRTQAAVRQAGCGTYDHERETFGEGCGWFGASDLLQAWNQQGTYKALDSALARIQKVLMTEKSLLRQISEFTFNAKNPHQYSVMTKEVSRLHEDVIKDELLLRISALNDFRGRMARKEMLQSGRSRLHVLAESVAVRSCRRRYDGLCGEYKSLLEAVIGTHQLIVDGWVEPNSDDSISAQAAGEDRGDKQDAENESSSTLPPDLSVTWPQAVLQALYYEADRALATALLDPLQSADGEKSTELVDSEFERELTQLAYEIQQDWGDSAKLRTVTHNLVIIRFDWESSNCYLLPVFHRLCVLLADVLYAYHLFENWHERMVQENLLQKAQHEDAGKEEKKSDVADEQRPQNDGMKEEFTRCLVLEPIRNEWLRAKGALWDRCEAVLVKCLEEYLHFAPHANVFKGEKAARVEEAAASDSRWRSDLEELHNVLVLSEEFASLKPTFFGGNDQEDPDEMRTKPSGLNNDFQDNLCNVFRKHLRHVHVEAMKSLGASLSQESWELVPLKCLSDIEKSSHLSASKDGEVFVAKLLVEALSEESRNIDKAHMQTRSIVSPRTLFEMGPATSTDNQFLRSNDPRPVRVEPKAEGTTQLRNDTQLEAYSEVYHLINSILAEGDDANSYTRLVSASASDVFFPWIARLLLVMERLPLIVEDITVVFANLCDLYFTTVFRICCGNGISERILLGIDLPTKIIQKADTYLPMSPTKPERSAVNPPLFGFRRRSSSSSMSGKNKSQIPKVDLPRNLQADICAPLWAEKSDLSFARKFILRSQDTLKDIVLLDKVDNWVQDPVDRSGPASQDDDDKIIVKAIHNLEQRVGAAWSCLGVAAILDATCSVARSKLMQSETGRKFVGDLATIEHYTLAVFRVLPQLVRVSSRISSVRAILARRVVSEIIEVGLAWEECKLNEHPNDYVDALCNRCSCIWASLAISPRKLPVGVRQATWEDMIKGAYASLLEGFSRVPFCSTEGRALMSMDLASFAAETKPSAVMERLEYDTKYDAPPKVDPGKGMRYVDTYIKVFYYPKKDVMAWIIENHEKYHLNHCLTLAANAYRGEGGDKEGASVEEVVEMVKGIFHQEAEDASADDSGRSSSDVKAPRIEQVV